MLARPLLALSDPTRAAAMGCALFAAVAGVSAVLGWYLNVPRLTDWANQGISMFVNPAVCGVLSAAAIALLVLPQDRRTIVAARFLGGLVLGVAALTLLEHVTGWDLRIDTLLLRREWGQTASAAPMRMGPPASVAFIVLGAATLLATFGARERTVASALASSAVVVVSLSLTGYLYGADQLFGVARFTGISLLTSMMIAALGVGMMLCLPEHGLIAALRRDDAGGVLLRRMIVPIIVVPLLLGWLRLVGQQLGVYDTEFGTAMRTLAELLLFLILLWWTANNISWHAATTRRAQSRLVAIIESSDDAIISKSLAGIIESWNHGAERTFGYTAEEAIGRSITMLIPPERISEETEIIRRLKAGERIEHFETVRVRKDGSRIGIALTVSPIRDVDGRVIGASKIARDITERRRIEERLVAIVESSEDAIVSKSLDGIIESWNKGAEHTFGYTAEEAIGRSITMIIPPDRLDEETEIISRLKRGQRIEHFETVRLHKDGAMIVVALTVSPVRDAGGKIVGASKIARDITERRRIEQRLRAIVEATPECVKIVAPDGTLQYMNNAGRCMIESEIDPTQLGGFVFDMIAPEYRQDWIERHQRICAGERLNWEFEIIGLKGTRRWMETHAVPLPLPDGSTGHLAVTREVTLRKTYEQEREALLESERAARGEAERASHLKDEFLATLSHELRTPLNAILGWSQLLTLSAEKADLEQGLDVIQRNARAQAQLIEDLLDMSRITSGKVRLDVQPTNLSTVVEAAVESSSPAADAKGILLRKVLDPHAGLVSGDPTRLQQIVWNLLTNAIKFTPRGGKVDVYLERVNSHVEIIVRDSGIGIPTEYLPVIFERFRQVDSSTTRVHGGLGLGLSIVKHLVELHGGTIKADSAGEGQGSTFVVALPLSPLRKEDDRVHPKAVRAATADYGPLHLQGIKVLVVDDEADARSLLERVLSQKGAEVYAAGSAEQALSHLRQFRPDVVVSDIGMPLTDGYQFIRSVRNLNESEGGRTPAIALTAFARSEDRMRAMLAGYQVHVAKPIEPQELVVTVRTLCRGIEAPAN